MKKLLIIILTTSLLAQNIIAEMRYNPITNLMYSHPEKPNIDQVQYCFLLLACAQIEANMKAMNHGKHPSKKSLLNQCSVYLKAIGTPTALRLISDLKSNKICYANGSFMKKIFE